MKKILLLLLFTVASYGQAVFDEGIQITGNANSTTATKVNVQEANGKVNTQTIKTGFNKNIGLGGSDVVGATTLLNQYSTTPVDWTATAFNSGQVVFYAGKQWIAKIATVAGDVPSVSSKWEEITFEALANKTVTVDQTIIDGSTNAVSSNAVFDGLALKSNIGHTHVASQITDLSKASVGLGNVDNTSDLSKPLSTATINALATKAPISSVHNPVTLGTANGLSLATQQLSLGLASSGVTGALSGTDWNTFNGKFNTPTGLTTNYLPKWNGGGFGNSNVFDNGTNTGIGTTNPTANLTVKGAYSVGSSIPANWALLSAGRTGVANNNKGLYLDIFNGYAEVSTYDWSLGQAYPMVFQGNGGNSMFGTNVDNGSKVQVNGTISASPATTANQVPTWGQVQAFVPSGTVNLTGAQTVAGVKTFSDALIGTTANFSGTVTVPNPVNPFNAATKQYVDAVVAKPYKVYTALLSQTATNAPTATVLENTLGGTVVWSYVSIGQYRGTLTGAFLANKTVVFLTNVYGEYFLTGGRENDNSVIIGTQAPNGGSTNGDLSNSSIEIRVYL